MKLMIVGLGNPGEKYQESRHNCGFIVVDEITSKESLGWQKKTKIKSLYTTKGDFIYLKPQTFMNKSGEAVGKALSYFKIRPQQLCLIHDDADIEKLQYKVQFGKQAAGHNGVDDVIAHLGTSDFWRVRIGIGRPEKGSFDLEQWVLSGLSPQELEDLKELSTQIEKELENIKSRLRL